jgi:hypothetical protein
MAERRRHEVQRRLKFTDGRVESCPPCVACGGEMICDQPGDFDPLAPKYASWDEAWDAYEFDDLSVFLMRCRKCSRLASHVEKRLTNTPPSEIIHQ